MIVLKEKLYYNQETQNIVKTKGFSVYNYISLDELQLTVRKDYLDILSAINIVFGVISIVLGVISYFSGSFFLLPIFLFFVYGVIFCILFLRLLLKTYYYLLISDIVYTKKGIFMGKEFFSFTQEKLLEKKLLVYEKKFLEYLGAKSILSEYIAGKRKDLLSPIKNKKTISQFQKVIKEISKGGSDQGDMGRILIPAIISFIVYVIFLYIFYWIGYVFGIVFVKIYTLVLRAVLYFKKNIEQKIKSKVEKIDENITKMNSVYLLLDKKMSEFSDGEISDISKFTETQFENFYTEIFTVYKSKEDLENTINTSQYKDFIDFKVFEKYLKSSFNKPINSMISMLTTHAGYIQKNIATIDKTTIPENELGGHLQTKKIILETNLNILLANITKLKESIL